MGDVGKNLREIFLNGMAIREARVNMKTNLL